jgi:RES domain-containing protein
LALTVTATAKTPEPGRFHVTGEFGALYLLTVELRLANVLDLTDPVVRAEWGLDANAVTSDDMTACQEVAAAARRAGYEAIRYTSATGEGENLALFYDRLHPGSSAVVTERIEIDPESSPGE